MAAFEWVVADEHIEWAMESLGIPEEKRHKPAIQIDPSPNKCQIIPAPYDTAEGVIGLIKEYDLPGQNPRIEAIFSVLGPLIDELIN